MFSPPPAFITGPERALAENQPSNPNANRACDKPSGDLSGVGIPDEWPSLPVVALALLVSVVPELEGGVSCSGGSLRSLTAALTLVLRGLARSSHIVLRC